MGFEKLKLKLLTKNGAVLIYTLRFYYILIYFLRWALPKSPFKIF